MRVGSRGSSRHRPGGPERPPARSGPPRTPPGSDTPASCAAGDGCTTARQKTHGTESREVHYPWHPWFGRKVIVVEGVRRSHLSVFRCRLEDDESGRALELPQWMLDRAACTRTRPADEPLVTCHDLRHLKSLVDSARGDDAGGAVDIRHPLPSSRGDADAPNREARKTGAA